MNGDKLGEEYDFVCSFYNDDVNPIPLKIQLQTLATQISEKNPSLIDLLQMFSEIVTLLKNCLVNPSTNAATYRICFWKI